MLTLAQAAACGVSAATVYRRADGGGWQRLYPGVYLVGGHRLTDEARVRAAWLWAGGEPAAVTGPAAAYWHGMLKRAPATVEVTVGRQRHCRPPRTQGPPPRPGLRRPGRHPGPVAGRPRLGRAGDGHRRPGRIRLPGPGAAAAREVSRAVPRVLPQPGSLRLGGRRTADLRRGRPGRLGGRTAAGHAAAGGRDQRLGSRPPVRPVPDRPRVPGRAAGRRGRRLGLARGRRAIPHRPAQGQRDHPGRLGSAAIHLARPRRPAARVVAEIAEALAGSARTG